MFIVGNAVLSASHQEMAKLKCAERNLHLFQMEENYNAYACLTIRCIPVRHFNYNPLLYKWESIKHLVFECVYRLQHVSGPFVRVLLTQCFCPRSFSVRWSAVIFSLKDSHIEILFAVLHVNGSLFKASHCFQSVCQTLHSPEKSLIAAPTPALPSPPSPFVPHKLAVKKGPKFKIKRIFNTNGALKKIAWELHQAGILVFSLGYDNCRGLDRTVGGPSHLLLHCSLKKSGDQQWSSSR